jgi:hypothetical protein
MSNRKTKAKSPRIISESYINQLAKKYGLSTSRYLVRRASDDVMLTSVAERQLLREALHELRFAANNINQIAHHLNSSRLTGTPPPDDDEIMNAISAMHAAATTKAIHMTIAGIKKRLKS